MPAIIALILIAIVALTVLSLAVHVLFRCWVDRSRRPPPERAPAVMSRRMGTSYCLVCAERTALAPGSPGGARLRPG